MSNELPISAARALRECDGYMDLKMWAQAGEALATVPAQFHPSRTYLSLQYRLHAETSNWPLAAASARTLCAQTPPLPEYWIMLAYSVRRADGIESARHILEEALRQFPDYPMISYNLACYECQLHHLPEAERLLKHAIKLDPKFRALARADDDLKPLRKKLKAAPE